MSINFINEFICCDIVSKLSDDVQLLHQELELLRRLQTCYKSLEEQYHFLLSELDVKLSSLPLHKKECKKAMGYISSRETTDHNINEFTLFIRRVWNNICFKIESNSRNDEFMSFIEGSPLLPIVEKIMEYVSFLSTGYLQYFPHQNCVSMVLELSHQLMDVMYPEIFSCNEFEKSLTFVTNAIPCLINLFTVMDLYTFTPRYDSAAAMCKEVIEEISLEAWKAIRITQPTLLPIKYLISLLNGELLGNEKVYNIMPAVEHSMGDFPFWVHQLTDHILECSVTPKPPINSMPLAYYKCALLPAINAQIINFFQPLTTNMMHRMGVLLDSPFRNLGPNKKPRRKSEESKLSNLKRIYSCSELPTEQQLCDLPPIKVPKLAEHFMKPFDY